MKKITTLLAAIAICSSLFAQAPYRVGVNVPSTSSLFSANNQAISLPSGYSTTLTTPNDLHPKTRGNKSLWMCYAPAADSYAVNTFFSKPFNNSGGAWDYLFPDSLPVAAYGTSYIHPSVVSYANVFDPYAQSFIDYYSTSGLNITSANDYTIDSMGFNFAYVRRSKNTSEVDTFKTVLYTDSVQNNILIWNPVTVLKNHSTSSTDTIKISHLPFVSYSNVTNTTHGIGAIKVNVLLHASDTGGGRFKSWPVHMHVPAGGIVASSITYKPGATYKLKDTLNKMNYVLLYANNELGKDSVTDYYNFKQTGFNNSPFANIYNYYHYYASMADSLFDRCYLPNVFYTHTNNMNNQYFWYHITFKSVGINNITQTIKNVSLYPNPSNATSELTFDAKDAGHVNVSLYDITGRLVSTLADYNTVEGAQQVAINTKNLTNGMYLVTITDATNIQITQKLMVNH